MTTWYVFTADVVITSDNNTLKFTETGVTKTATIPTGTYRLRGDGTATDLLKAVTTALDAAGATWTADLWTRVDNTQPTAVVRLSVSGVAFASILWADAASTFPSESLGFTANTASGLAWNSTVNPTGVWASDEPPVRDDHGTKRLVSQSLGQDGTVSTVVRGDVHRTRLIGVDFVHPARTFTQAGGVDSWESWVGTNGDGRAVEVHALEIDGASHAADATTAGLTGVELVLEPMTLSTRLDGRVWILSADTLEQWTPRRLDAGVNLFAWNITLLEAI